MSISLDASFFNPDQGVPAKEWTKNKQICPLIARIHYLLYDHPLERKIAEVAGYIIGSGMILAACFTPAGPVIGLIIAGSLVIAVTKVATKILNCIAPKAHDMKTHSFKADKFIINGKCLGELYYENDIPILKINSEDPYDAGYTQGYLLMDALKQLSTNVKFCIFTLARQKRPSEIKDILTGIKDRLPEKYVLELEGLVDGYNDTKGFFDQKLTFDDLLYLQLLPDKTYFQPQKFQSNSTSVGKAINELQTAGCTVIGMLDESGKPLFARTMDWPSFGKAGALSLIVSRINPTNKMRSAEVCVPGLIGTLTGVNSSGLTVSMNVTKYKNGITTIDGMPATLYNRFILEECTSFEDAKFVVESEQPMGPYHLTVSDETQAGTFSMYQAKDWTGNWVEDRNNGALLRVLEEQKPLVTTNTSYNSNRVDMFNAKIREELIKGYFEQNQLVKEPKKVLEFSQTIPWVNNHLTTHRVILGSKTLKVAFDNAWAGDRSFQELNLSKLFNT